MSDIIDRIRDTETMPLSSVAARADVQNILQEAREEIARLRLTDAERDVIARARRLTERVGNTSDAQALAALLVRHKEIKQ